MVRCTGRDIPEIMLKTALNAIQSIDPEVDFKLLWMVINGDIVGFWIIAIFVLFPFNPYPN